MGVGDGVNFHGFKRQRKRIQETLVSFFSGRTKWLLLFQSLRNSLARESRFLHPLNLLNREFKPLLGCRALTV